MAALRATTHQNPAEAAHDFDSVVETTDPHSKVGHYTNSEELTRLLAFFKRTEALNPHNQAANNPDQSRGTLPMQELKSPYAHAAYLTNPHLATPSRRFASTGRFRSGRFAASFIRLPLLQKILISNIVIILGGAMIGSWLTAQLAEAGHFNLVTFTVIIVSAVLLSSAVSFTILKLAFRPFEEMKSLLTTIHAGNPRARAALNNITDPDHRQFSAVLNQMLVRLEENARIIQEDQRQLQLMTAQVINAQENERKRIARELHDEASQSLTAMIMGLQAAHNSAPAENTALCSQLVSLKELATATLEELRKLALDLRPTMLDDLGLVPAVRWLSRNATERANLDVRLDLAGFEEGGRLAPEMETCLFRITQESLTNIVKHARATQVEIRLERLPENQVQLTVEDNGCGFDRGEARAKAYRGGHLGLFDIEERAALLSGHVQIELAHPQRSNCGTRITVTLPQPPALD